jgi:hypothetical protein
VTSPRLADLQAAFTRILTEPAGVDAALALPEGKRVAPLVSETPALGRKLRLAVYADAYFARLLEALEHDFPSVRSALGPDAFRDLAAAYAQANPPSSPNLTDLGERLPEFVQADPRPWLPELAALDWHALLALYSDRGTPLDRQALAARPPSDWPRLRFEFSPSLRLLRTGWDVDRVRAGKAKAPRRAARALAIWRDEEWVRVERLPPAEADALEALRAGLTLSEACESAYPPLDRWFSLGWLTGANLA